MRLTHVFVDSFPEPLEKGKLYVSMRYANVAHLCACGCGNEVVTPIRKRAWRLTFDGESITLSPSIGSRTFACRSHYFIRENKIQWAEELLPDEGLVAVKEFETEASTEPLMPPVDVPAPSRRQWWMYLIFWKRFPKP
jgi:hypothetical protein